MIAPDSMPEEEYIVGRRRQIMPEDSMPDYVPEDIDEETLNKVVMPMWDIFVPAYRQIYESNKKSKKSHNV
jgi:hypothetical protein